MVCTVVLSLTAEVGFRGVGYVDRTLQGLCCRSMRTAQFPLQFATGALCHMYHCALIIPAPTCFTPRLYYSTVQCYLLIVLQYYNRDPRAPVYTGAAKFKLFQTLATSFIWRHGWISANPFVMESALCVEDRNIVLVSPGGVGRTRCSLITPEVRFPVGGCCSPYAIRILPWFAVYNTVSVAICYRSCLSIYERTSIVHSSPPSS